jgi:hypothetical protein
MMPRQKICVMKETPSVHAGRVLENSIHHELPVYNMTGEVLEAAPPCWKREESDAHPRRAAEQPRVGGCKRSIRGQPVNGGQRIDRGSKGTSEGSEL